MSSSLSALTSPYDRENVTNSVVSNDATPLTQEQLEEASKDLIDHTSLNYPQLDRYFKDPVYSNQVFCLHSFVPARGAVPDEHGIYGFMKCRGTFSSLTEANQRSEFIIRNMDSYHKILTSYCGHPFPICSNSEKYTAEVKKVDMKKEMLETISNDVKEKRLQEKKEIEEMKEREKALMDISQKSEKDEYKEDPMDVYTTQRVKFANQIWTYHSTMKKMEDLKKNMRKTRDEINLMDSESSDYKNQYLERYNNARRTSGLDSSPNYQNEDNFLKYMCEDLDTSFLDE